MCSNMGGTTSTGRANISDIPQSWIDFVLEKNPEADLQKVATAWRENKAQSERLSTTADNIKVGDSIDGNKVMIDDGAKLKNAESYAYWNTKRSDGTVTRQDYKDLELKVTKVEKKGNTVKITAEFDLDGYKTGQNRGKRTLYRTFKANDLLKRY